MFKVRGNNERHDGNWCKLSLVSRGLMNIANVARKDHGIIYCATFLDGRPLNTGFLNMATRITTPLLKDSERIYSTEETGGPQETSTDSRFLSLADQLGVQPDALSRSSSAEREKENDHERDRRRHKDPVVNISFEQLEELLTALDSTSDMLRQVGLNSVELESLTRQRR